MTVSFWGNVIGLIPKFTARKVRPMNRTPSRMAITPRVVAAFFASGGLNAGTPVAIASVPVRATAPAANARRSNRMVIGWTVSWTWLCRVSAYVAPSPRTTIRKVPTAIMIRADPTNR